MSRFHTAVLAATVFASLPPVRVEAADSNLRVATAELFRLGWTTKYSQRVRTDSYYESASQSINDVRFRYAYSLVLMKQRRYKEAAEELATINKILPNNVQVSAALTWSRISWRQYSAALLDLDRMSATIASQLYEKDGTAKKLAAVKRLELITALRHVGELTAYLDYPVRERTSDKLRSHHRDRIVARFQPKELAEFRRAQQQVIDMHNLWQKQIALATLEGRERDKKHREQDLKDLDDIRASIQRRKEDLKDENEKARDKTDKRQDDLRKRADPIDRELTAVNNSGAASMLQSTQIDWDLSQLYRQLRRTRDPLLRNFIRREIFRLENLLRVSATETFLAGLQANSLVDRRARLQAESNLLENRFQKQLYDAKKEGSQLDKRERRATAQQRRLRKSGPKVPRNVIGLRSKASLLSTYSEFPLELEKQRVLDIKP